MELMLPQKRKTEKKYKHFFIESIPQKESSLSKRMDFFYIGNNSFKINFLVKAFEGGYALDNVEKAIPFLMLNSEKLSIPDIIIIDNRITDNELTQLGNFISNSSVYSKIPVVVDAGELTDIELGKFRAASFIDDILFLNNISKEGLIFKAEFLKRVKEGPETNLLEVREPYSSNPVFNLPLFLKRVFDIISSAIAILLLLPFFMIIALLIKLESKGPVFYIAKRAGKGYKVFNFYKFRTMVADADKKVKQLSHLNQYSQVAGDGPVFFKVSNDPRITKIGAFLRNTSLDELPQLLNVFLGDMSLVGNRPLPLYEAATLTTDQHAARFMAPAGITGLWQIKKRGDSNMSVEERINLDIDYAQKFSFVYDLWIIANTPTALLQKDNV